MYVSVAKSRSLSYGHCFTLPFALRTVPHFAWSNPLYADTFAPIVGSDQRNVGPEDKKENEAPPAALDAGDIAVMTTYVMSTQCSGAARKSYLLVQCAQFHIHDPTYPNDV